MAKVVELKVPEITLLPTDENIIFKVLKPCVVELPLVRGVKDDEAAVYEFWIADEGASVEFIAEQHVTILSYKDYSYTNELGAAVVVERWGGNTYAIAGLIESKP